MVSALVPVAALLIALAPGPDGGLSQVAACVGAGGTGRGGGLPLTDVHALADGSGVRVAVIDTGVAPHPRLPRLTGGGDYLTGGDGLTDCDGHGTAVAGLLAAAPSPDDDVVGVAPGVEVLAIRQASPSFTVTTVDGGTRPAGDTASLAQAVRRAVGLGAAVVTISEA
ncbi:S8 family serine peptidase, partial [Pseudonocardia kujensis]|uniref:S8 family serine peptidase n=1 Tax=Pseudonocardia kujensis TaxID=1128675 RepID=UPI001E5E4A1C